MQNKNKNAEMNEREYKKHQHDALYRSQRAKKIATHTCTNIRINILVYIHMQTFVHPGLVADL